MAEVPFGFMTLATLRGPTRYNPAVLAQAGTPPAERARLAAAIRLALAEPAVAASLAELGVEVPEPTGPDASAAFIAAEVRRFRAVAVRTRIQLERP